MAGDSSYSTPTDGYYDPWPQCKLDRPIAVCSFFGGGGSSVAKRLAALGGWRHVDVYEETAHRLGQHRAAVGTSMENPDWCDAEERVLESAINRTPAGIIGLTEGCLVDERTIDLLRFRTHLVMVDVDILRLQERLLDENEANPERFPEFTERPIPDLHTLRLLHKERSALYDAAAVRIDATRLSPAVAARRTLKALRISP